VPGTPFPFSVISFLLCRVRHRFPSFPWFTLVCHPTRFGTGLGDGDVADRFGGASFTLPVEIARDNGKDRRALRVVARDSSG